MKNLEKTIAALKDGLTDLGVAKGIKNIEGWMEALDNAEFRGAKTIHENLGKLKHQLESDKIDGSTVAELMKMLGDETKRTASHADGQAESVTELGELLGKSSTALSK